MSFMYCYRPSMFFHQRTEYNKDKDNNNNDDDNIKLEISIQV